MSDQDKGQIDVVQYLLWALSVHEICMETTSKKGKLQKSPLNQKPSTKRP